jgi:hypothetical protein
VGNFVDPPSGSPDVECQLLEAAKAGDSEQVQRLLTSYPQIVNCRGGRCSCCHDYSTDYLNLGLVHPVAPVFNENHKSIAFVRNLSRLY